MVDTDEINFVNVQAKPPDPDPKPGKKVSVITRKIEGFDIEIVIEDEIIKLYYDAAHNYLVDTFTKTDDLEMFLLDYVKFLKMDKNRPKDDTHDDHKKNLSDKGWHVKPGKPDQLKNVEKEK